MPYCWCLLIPFVCCVEIQSLIVPAPPGERGSFVCETFVSLAASSASGPASSSNSSLPASLIHSPTSVSSLPSHLTAILCLHGGGQTRHTWSGAALELARRLPVVVVTADLRGHGESFWGTDYSLTTYGKDVDYLVQSGGLSEARPLTDNHYTSSSSSAPSSPRRVVLVGASQGGLSIMMSSFAARAAGVVLVDIAPRIERAGCARIVGFMLGTSQRGFANVKEAVEAIAAYQPHREPPLESQVSRHLSWNASEQRYYWRWDPRFITSRCGLADSNQRLSPSEVEGALACFVEQMEEESARLDRAASRITSPCLIVRADQSDVLSQAGVQNLRELLPHADNVDVSNAHHMVVGDAADVFTGTICVWIGKVIAGNTSTTLRSNL